MYCKDVALLKISLKYKRNASYYINSRTTLMLRWNEFDVVYLDNKLNPYGYDYILFFFLSSVKTKFDRIDMLDAHYIGKYTGVSQYSLHVLIIQHVEGIL